MLTDEQRGVLRTISPKDGIAYFAGVDENKANSHLAHATLYLAKEGYVVVGVDGEGRTGQQYCDYLLHAMLVYYRLIRGRDLVKLVLNLRRVR